MFDLQGFEGAKFFARQERVPVSALASFFPEGEDPSFLVQGLNSDQLHVALEAGKTAKNVDAIIKALANDNKPQVNAIREAIGLGESTPAEVRKRIEMLVFGCVEPKLNHAIAAKLAENFPIEFQILTNKISELTGQGFDLEKPEAVSPETQS